MALRQGDWRAALGVSRCSVLLAGTAGADDALKLTELSPNGADACFGRVYDAAHLKAHPKQKVARIFFYYGHDPVSRPNEEPAANADTSYNGFVTTTVRGAKAPEWAGGWCNHQSEDGTSGPIRCGMDCDRTHGVAQARRQGPADPLRSAVRSLSRCRFGRGTRRGGI